MRTVDLIAAESHPPIVGSTVWKSEDDTRAFAARLAAHPAIADVFIELHGELGAGKTTLVRHLLRALGVQGRVKSPTYTVVEPYEVLRQAQDERVGGAQDERLSIWHFDFYRFGDPREWEDAGFRDLFASPGLKLAEWPEKAGPMLPPADLELWIEVAGDESRQVRLLARTPAGQELLQ